MIVIMIIDVTMTRANKNIHSNERTKRIDELEGAYVKVFDSSSLFMNTCKPITYCPTKREFADHSPQAEGLYMQILLTSVLQLVMIRCTYLVPTMRESRGLS